MKLTFQQSKNSLTNSKKIPSHRQLSSAITPCAAICSLHRKNEHYRDRCRDLGQSRLPLPLRLKEASLRLSRAIPLPDSNRQLARYWSPLKEKIVRASLFFCNSEVWKK
jgi:hypothetical protein